MQPPVPAPNDPGPAPEGRRPVWTETRRRIVESARELFSERGYRGATTKDIADAAGVAELTLFRHFPTKAQLFEEAAVEPIHEFLRSFVTQWRDRPLGTRDTAQEGIHFFGSLMDLLAREEKLVASIVSAIASDDSDIELSPEVFATMSMLLDDLEEIFREESARRGYRLDPHIAPRAMTAMALGIAVCGEWLFGAGKMPEREKLVAEMAKLAVGGLTAAP